MSQRNMESISRKDSINSLNRSRSPKLISSIPKLKTRISFSCQRVCSQSLSLKKDLSLDGGSDHQNKMPIGGQTTRGGHVEAPRPPSMGGVINSQVALESEGNLESVLIDEFAPALEAFYFSNRACPILKDKRTILTNEGTTCLQRITFQNVHHSKNLKNKFKSIDISSWSLLKRDSKTNLEAKKEHQIKNEDRLIIDKVAIQESPKNIQSIRKLGNFAGECELEQIKKLTGGANGLQLPLKALAIKHEPTPTEKIPQLEKIASPNFFQVLAQQPPATKEKSPQNCQPEERILRARTIKIQGSRPNGSQVPEKEPSVKSQNRKSILKQHIPRSHFKNQTEKNLRAGSLSKSVRFGRDQIFEISPKVRQE